MPGFIIRGFLYFISALLLGLLFYLEPTLAKTWRPYTEYGYVQITQSILLFSCVLLLGLKAWRDVDYRQLSLCMGTFFLILLIRENDQPLELFLPHGAWKYFALVPLVALIACMWRRWAVVKDQLLDWSRSFSYGVMLAALTVLVFARIFASKHIWMRVMGEDYRRYMKNAAEEGVELLALGLILVAVVEFVISRRPVR